jgi:hypothetical protein
MQSFLSYMLDVLYAHPEHRLLPIYRLHLYEMLGLTPSRDISGYNQLWKNTPDSFRRNNHAYRHLAFVTARHTFHIYAVWLDSLPQTFNSPIVSEKRLPEQLLQTCAQLREGVQQQEPVARHLLNQAEAWLYWFGDDADQEIELRNPYHAAMAIQQSVRAMLGAMPFGTYIDESVTDELPLEHDGDVAHHSLRAYATVAYSGVQNHCVIRDARLDTARSLAFWEWWLTEAVPTAWDIAQQSETGHD